MNWKEITKRVVLVWIAFLILQIPLLYYFREPCDCDCTEPVNIDETIYFYKIVTNESGRAGNETNFIQTSDSTVYYSGTIVANWSIPETTIPIPSNGCG